MNLECLYNIKQQNTPILCSIFQKDKIFFGLSNGEIVVHNKNFKGNIKTKNYKINNTSILDLAVNDKHNFLATCSLDNTIKLIDFKNLDNFSIKNINIHSGCVKSINFSNNGKFLLSSSDDKTTKLTNTYSGNVVKSFNSHLNWVTSNLFINNDLRIVTGSSDKTVIIQDIEKKSILKTLNINSKINKLNKLSDESCFGVGTNNGYIKIYDCRSGNLIQNYNIHNSSINDFVFHNSGLYLLSASDDELKLLDLRVCKEIFTVKTTNEKINTLAIHDSENIFLTGGSNKKAYIWNYDFDLLYNNVNEKVLTDYFKKNNNNKTNFDIKYNDNNNNINQKLIIKEIQEDKKIENTFDKIINQLQKIDNKLDNFNTRLNINEDKILQLNSFVNIN